MSTLLKVRKAPVRVDSTSTIGHPIKGIVAKRFWGHDGSLCGAPIIVTDKDLDWFEGVLAASVSKEDRRFLREVCRLIETYREAEIRIEE